MSANSELVNLAGASSQSNAKGGGGDNSPSVIVNGKQMGDNQRGTDTGICLSVTSAQPVGDAIAEITFLKEKVADISELVDSASHKFLRDLNAYKCLNEVLSSRNASLEKALKEKETAFDELNVKLEKVRRLSKEELKYWFGYSERVNIDMAALRKQLQDEIKQKDKLCVKVTLKESELFEIQNQRDFLAGEKAVAENELHHEKEKVIALTDEIRKLKAKVREMATKITEGQNFREQALEKCNFAWGAIQNLQGFLGGGKAVPKIPEVTNYLEQAADDSGLGDSTPEHIPQSPSASPRKRALEEGQEPSASGSKSPKIGRDVNSFGESQSVMKQAIANGQPELMKESMKAGPLQWYGPPVLQSSPNYSGGHSRTKESAASKNGESPTRGRGKVLSKTMDSTKKPTKAS